METIDSSVQFAREQTEETQLKEMKEKRNVENPDVSEAN